LAATSSKTANTRRRTYPAIGGILQQAAGFRLQA
jgi:hypothetical protein